MDFTAALSTATATISLVKSLKDLDQALDKSELKMKMAELYSNLAEVKMALVDAEEVARSKDTEIETLKKDLEFRASLVDVQGFKYQSREGTPTGLPYCPLCEVKEGKFYQLARLDNYGSNCKNCGNYHNAGPDGCVNQDAQPTQVFEERW